MLPPVLLKDVQMKEAVIFDDPWESTTREEVAQVGPGETWL